MLEAGPRSVPCWKSSQAALECFVSKHNLILLIENLSVQKSQPEQK